MMNHVLQPYFSSTWDKMMLLSKGPSKDVSCKVWKFGSTWLSGCREHENVKVYGRRISSNDKSSHGLWPGEAQKDQVWH